MNENISMSVIRRLPRYYRYLTELEKNGKDRVSSSELAGIMGLTASQIRQDFNKFGGFGLQGYGYSVSSLKEEIAAILNLSEKTKCILVGAGNLGHALSGIDFSALGFDLVGIFDNDASKTGQTVNGREVLDYSCIENFCKDVKPVMAIICTPDSAVAFVADDLYRLGI